MTAADSGTCCGCFNYRQASVVTLGMGLVFGMTIVFLFTYLAFDPLSITQAIVREKILGNASVAIFIFNSLVPLVCLGVLFNAGFTSGMATKIMAFLIFMVGLMWIVYGATLARKFNSGFINFTPSGYFFKKYAKDPSKSRNMVAAVGSALVLDRAAATLIMQNAPFPLNYFYWMGMWPIIPFIFFGAIPAVVTWIAVGPMVNLSSVMDAGGDGTEYVEAKKIHWFYSLSPADRERVREGSDLDNTSDDDSDDDAERGNSRKKPAAAH